MKAMIKTFIFLIFLFSYPLSALYALTTDELMQIHRVTTTEMNNIASPQAGSLVFNTTEDTLYFYTGTIWKRLRANGSETVIQAGNGITISGNGTSTTPYSIGSN
jgi:hypothetical protein